MRKPLEWQYSRNRKLHWVDDGEFYEIGGNNYRLWEISTDRPMGFIKRKTDMYTLRLRGGLFGEDKTVAKLKQIAERYAEVESIRNAASRERLADAVAAEPRKPDEHTPTLYERHQLLKLELAKQSNVLRKLRRELVVTNAAVQLLLAGHRFDPAQWQTALKIIRSRLKK